MSTRQPRKPSVRSGPRQQSRKEVEPSASDEGRGAIEEINESRRTEARERATRFGEIIDALPSAVFTTDAVGALTHFNPAAERYFGHTPELGIGVWCAQWKFLRADGVPLAPGESPMERALRENRRIDGELIVGLRPDGTRVWLETHSQPLHDANGRVNGGMHMLADVSERRRQELELNEVADARTRLSDELETLYKTAPIGMAQLDRDLRYLRVNDALAGMNGIPAAEHLGRTLREVIPERADQVEAAFLDVIATGEPVTGIEISGQTPDQPGVQRAWLESWFPLRDAAGRVVGLNVLAQEITERKLAERKLRESEERYRSLTKALTSIVWTSDPEGRFVGEQPMWARFTGQTWEEYRGFGWVLALHEEDRERVFAQWDEASRTRSPYASTGRLWHAPSNAYRYFEARAVPIFDTDGSVREWVGKYLDVEERQRAQKRADELVKQLQEGDQRKDEFLAMLAHELRGPLAPLANMLEILKRSDGDADMLRKARVTMERQLAQMVRLVDDLLDVSRISRNKIELRTEKVELATILNQALEMARPLAERAHHEVAVVLPPGPVLLNADPARLAQVFGNLLNNACKYTAPGGRISLVAKLQGDEVMVRVRDNGMGIPPEMLPRIFDMFIQVDRSIERTQGGLGIGLTLVRRLIQMHGGTVQATSAGIGHGTEFEVHLPVLSVGVNAPEPAGPAQAVPHALNRILVVDDNRDSAASLSMLLEIGGRKTRVAHDGLEAVATAAEFRPDVILLDIGLPKINGREACRRIRAEPWGKEIVMVALSGWGQEEDRRKSLEAGFDAHLVKPLDYDALGPLIGKLSDARKGRGADTR